MRRGFIGLSVGIGLIACSSIGTLAADDPPKGRTIVVTREMNDKEIAVRAGDELVLRLPPATAALVGRLRRIAGPTASCQADACPLERRECERRRRLRASQLRYRVTEVKQGKTAEWIFCKFGKPVVNGKKIEPGEPLKADELPTKNGTTFRIKLKLDDTRP